MDPNSDEAALHRAIQDRPHDATPRLVLADFYDDHGMPEHALAHRWISGEHKPPTNHYDWSDQTRGMDKAVLAGVVGEEVRKSSAAAARKTGRSLREYEHHGMSWLTDSADRAARYSTPDTSGRSSPGLAASFHVAAMRGHADVASNHEALSHVGTSDTDEEYRRKVEHRESGQLHRLAQNHQYLAGDVARWAEHDLTYFPREDS